MTAALATSELFAIPAAATPAVVDRSGCLAPRHGDRSAYLHCHCRCSDAVAVNAAYRAGVRAHNRATGQMQPLKRARIVKELPPGMVASTPTGERLRILAALGYSWGELASLIGQTGPQGVAALACMTQPTVAEATAVRVRDVFARLIRQPAPFGPGADRALERAIRAGWGVVDMVAVRRAICGAETRKYRRTVPLTALEKRAVIYYGAVIGLTETAISRVSPVSGATINAALAA